LSVANWTNLAVRFSALFLLRQRLEPLTANGNLYPDIIFAANVAAADPPSAAATKNHRRHRRRHFLIAAAATTK